MKGLILCEGNADRILISYYLLKILNFRHVSPRDFEEDFTPLGFNKNDFDWYSNAIGDSLLIGSVGGYDFIPAVGRFMEWNQLHQADKCFDKVVVITDNDDVSAAQRLNDIVKEITSEQKQEVACQPNQWYEFEYEDGFGVKSSYKFLFLLQPMEGYGNLETFTLDALAMVSPVDNDVVEKARQYIAGIDRNNGIYLKGRGERNKAELSAYFSVVAPKRTFDPINKLLLGIEWGDYEQYNEQFGLLKQLVVK